ncbi:hypothetical protein [Agromyces tropicus]|uniref:hypothetical protein n=1 Tax=Agromyces tropicus TaxID=555371 RepID=UPI0031D4C17E
MSAGELVADLGPRWLVVPAGIGADDRDAWVRSNVDRVRALGEDWPADAAELVPALLAHAVDRRGEDHLVLTFWPSVVPLPATVRISVLASPGRAAIADELRARPTSRAEHVDGARLGPGVEWVHADALPGERGEQLIGIQACFADDETMVLVTLDPTLPALLPHVADPVRELARTVERVRAGHPWVARPLPEGVGTRSDRETWPAWHRA